MGEFKFCICDDSPEFLNAIEEVIRKTVGNLAECNVLTANDGESLLSIYQKELPDAVFLDIEMPNLNGFETADALKKINENVNIIFITSFDDKVYESWSYQPFWFVRKSHLKDLETVLLKLVKKLREKQLENTSIKLKGENRIFEFEISDIVSFESDGHYINVQGKAQCKARIRSKISDIEKQVSDRGFVRVNRGIIVNIREISIMSAKAITMKNGTTYSIGRDRTTEVKHSFLEYMRR